MLYLLSDKTIKLTRGDTARFAVSIVNGVTDDDYILAALDELVLTVKRSVKDEIPLFQKNITGSNVFHIEPVDTAELTFGKYKYDIQLNKENGDVHTIVEPSCFEVLPEVTY